MDLTQSMRLNVPGAQLHVEKVGADGRQPLLLLHGGPGADSRYLRPQCDAFAALSPCGQPLQLIYYDQRGAERSPLSEGEPPGDVATHVLDVERVRVFLEQPRLCLAGYSWGGLLALLYALAYPDKVERLILISPAPAHASGRVDMQENLRLAALRPSVQALRERWLSNPDNLDPQVRRRYQFALAVSGYFVDPEKALELTPFRVVQRVEDAIWRSLATYDLRDKLDLLRSIPSLVIHGEQDVIPIHTAQETAMRMGASFVALPSCGHVPYVEQPTAFWDAICAWLAQA